MADGYDLHDPLSINLLQQTRLLVAQLPSNSSQLSQLQNVSSRVELFNRLSRLLATPGFTILVATLFRPLLLDLCARWLADEESRQEKLEACALLLEVHPEIFPVLSQLLLSPNFSLGPLGFLQDEQSLASVEATKLHQLLLAYYRLLHANNELPRIYGWPLSLLSRIIWECHPDTGVRFLAIRCYALQSGMVEGERVKMENDAIGKMEEVECPISWDSDVYGNREVVDGWIIPIKETERVFQAQQALLLPQKYYMYEEGDSVEPIHPAELSPLIVNVHGVLMLRSSTQSPTPSPLVSTPTTTSALRDLAVHLSLNIPTLLTSPPSSGKSLLLTHLAAAIHPDRTNQVVTIHLADTSLDPRSLLGSYVSSPTRPGTFEWKEGVLVKAMREGRWVVFEDIDRGSNEVLGLVKPLVESLTLGKWVGGRARMEVPSRGLVLAAQGFSIFATRSIQSGRNDKFPSPTFFGAHKFHEVIVPSPTQDDLQTIVDVRFPRLAGPAGKCLIRLWDAVRQLGFTASTRDIGVRELEKLCLRIDKLLPSSYQPMDIDHDSAFPPSLSSLFPNPTIREDMLSECRDVFFGAGATTTAARIHFSAISSTVAEHLGLSVERRDWVLQERVPEYSEDKDINGVLTSLSLGRTRLFASATKPGATLPTARSFAMHKPAKMLLSSIASSVSLQEPILLTGETGTGKTSIVSHLASLLRKPLISLNLSNQTEASDIVGGFKPVDARVPAIELHERFSEMFGRTFSRKKNAHFEESVRKAVQEGKWKRAVALWSESARLAKERIQARLLEDSKLSVESDLPRKRRKTENGTLDDSEKSWTDFEQDVRTFEIQHVQGNGKFAFAFVEGPLVKALRLGHWILLDEVNLASAETLECISALLHGPTASITLTEQGSLEPVPRHPDFRLFACMNPATDVGKKDLPPNIRSRFTELDVPPPDADKDTLLSIVTHYIGHYAVGDRGAIMDVTEFYSGVRTLSERREIADGSNHRPHFSMRTLARALTFAADLSRTYSLRRALWEGCLMAFTMALDGPSASKVTALAQRHILAGVKNPRSLLAKEPLPPHGRPVDDYIKFGPFYLERGSLPEDPADDYIITPSVETKLVDLARIIVTRRFPVLIEGPTSSGKTSSIEYLAKRTGHRFVRINNHEHTDIQEYLGTYVSDSRTGKLVFKDGLLVRALRHGDWIVLDELNLAPTDVLEALNRLLDDNRELVIPETQEVVKPHPSFMLFATQNPPGLYGGRKVLSRAFRNRFLEVHYEEVPQAELETILCQRCRIAPSYGQRIVAVFQELQKRRQSNRIFESKHGFATLRDLFRWAGRDAMDYQELADNGYMLLAERARREEDKKVVKEVIESIMKVSIDPIRLYALQDLPVDLLAYLGVSMSESSSLVWTSAMKRLFTLVARALRFNEPVLLVGETGSGKTSVFQAFAEITGKKLHAVNCHQNTETADLIGSLRPLRNRTALESEAVTEAIQLLQSLGHPLGDATDVTTATTAVDRFLRSTPSTSSHHHALMQASYKLHRLTALFDWHDGPLIQAMRSGDVFLMDEISLADDSVLERLNSVLEPARTIVLAEQGGTEDIPAVRADDGFKLVATMNPGGDYGKKELSPALRNRFTEVWVPAVDTRQDLDLIVRHTWRYNELHDSTSPLLDFVEWLSARVADRSIVTLRDILAWVGFVNVTYEPGRSNASFRNAIFHHAAQMTFLDGLGTLPQLSSYSNVALEELKRDATARLDILFPLPRPYDDVIVTDDSSKVQLGSFSISRGPLPPAPSPFSFQAPTTRSNVNRVLRACQLPKPILLEGSPGVGKTSLVAALANVAGHQLCRINLSDQTDLVDLFGSDLPVEGGSPGQFAWKDADFLRALQEGHWVLLDEMNLAPQAVLEGLNAVLDHRGTVYIPELGRSFMRHPSFRIFAAQNPLHQGGGRKGLPKSFLNRFTKVHVRELSQEDTIVICRSVFPTMPMDILQGMVNFTAQLNEEAMTKKSFARAGAPWEFNLRDILRWGSLAQGSAHSQLQPEVLIDMLFLQRFRTPTDRTFARELFERFVPNVAAATSMNPSIVVSPGSVRIGGALNIRQGYLSGNRPPQLLHQHLPALQALATCIANGWLAILTGERSKGKKSVVRFMANITGNSLQEIFINSATDAADILGSYEEVDPRARAMSTLSTALDSLKLLSASLEGSRLTTMVYLMDALYTSLSNDAQPSLDKLLKLASQIKATLDVHTIPSNDLKLALDALGSATQGTSRFEWVDGPLIRALKAGHWVLLDGANLCNPSVLDRLNSLCESNGFLTLNEKGAVHGTVETIKPHPNFRLFMTVDSHFGELSRAMRNRGVEIALTDTVNPHDSEIIADYLRLPRQQPFAMTDPRQAVRDAEYLKRGLQVTENLAAVSSSALSTKLLAEDSGSSAVLDLTQTLQTFESTIRGSQNADTYVAAYCIAPSQLPLFRRLICSFSDPNTRWINILATMNNLELCAVRTIVQTQKDSSHLTGLTDGIILSQSLDLEIYPEIWSFDTSSATSRQLLRLIAASSTFPTTEIQVLRAGEQSKAEQNAREILLALVQNIQSSAVKTYEEVQMTAIDAEETLAFATRLLSFASYLLRVGAEDRLDYSALYATSRWLLESFREPRAGFRSVEMHVQALHGVVALTSGRGLSEIWSSLSSYLVQDVQTSKIAELDDIARNLPSKLSSLRSRIFDLMTLITLTWTKSLPNEESINAIAEQLRSQLPDMWSLNARDTQKESADPMHLLTELNLIAGLNVVQGVPLPQTFRRGVEELLDIVIQDPEHSLSRFTSFRHVLWLDETTQLSVASIFAIYRQWLRSIWSTSLHEIQGPSILQAPTMLRSTALHCDRTDQDMIRLSHREEALRRHVRMIALSSATYHPRDRQLGTILLQMLIMVVSCFHDAISDADSSELQQVSSTLQDVPFESSFSKIIDILQRVNHQGLRSAVAQCLQSSTRPLGHLGHPSYEKLGEYWVELAQLLLILFVPSSPIDPASLEKSSTDFWAEQKAQLAAQISLLTDFAKRTQGNVTNGAIRSLAGLASEVSTGLATSDHVPVARTDLRRLHTYWAEVHQFISQVVSPTRLQPFLEAAQSGEATASMRETVIQGSIGAFCQRLDTVYPDFLDINFPLQAALYAMRLGLRLMTVPSSPGPSGPAPSTSVGAVNTLIVSPSILSAELWLEQHQEEGSSASFSTILAQLTGISFLLTLGGELEQHIPRIALLYEQAYGLWSIDHVRAEDKEREAQSLYRNQRGQDNLTDAELEEQDFLALFPEFEDLLDDGVASLELPPIKKAELVTGSSMSSLMQVHQEFFLASPSVSLVGVRYDEERRSIVAGLLETDSTEFSSALDVYSLPFQIDSLRNEMVKLHSIPASRGRAYDFYFDENIPEIRKAIGIVSSLIRRVDVLIAQWPEQMVLQHLKSRCEAILKLSFRSPIARILSALEQLLGNIEDWEMYANRENSLKEETHSLTTLIVEWRRLELSAWQGLLDRQARDFSSTVSEWWFRLYDAVIRGVMHIAHADMDEEQSTFALTNFLEDLVPLLDEFMRSSAAGQYHARLSLLHSMEIFAASLSAHESNPRRAWLLRVRSILHTTRQYYSQFASNVSNSLSNQRAALEKDIRGFIKLASWRDVNVHALKQSAQKTHRQLYKIIRKFRDVLRQPVAPLLTWTSTSAMPEQPSVPQTSLPPLSVITFPTTSSTLHAAHLTDLSRTYDRFASFIRERISEAVVQHDPRSVESLADDILRTSELLAKETIPKDADASRRKTLQKNLLNRKRKAWSDFMKELKRAGIPSGVKPEVLSQHHSKHWPREQPILPPLTQDDATIVKAEYYLYRLFSEMPALRESLSTHHSDISRRDLQRASLFAESILSIAVRNRTSLAKVSNQFEIIQRMIGRMRMLSARPKIVAAGECVEQAILYAKETTIRLCEALEGITDTIRNVKEEVPSFDAPPHILELISDMITSLQPFKRSLGALWNDVHSSEYRVLLDDEATIVTEAVAQIKNVTSSLQSLLPSLPHLRLFVEPIVTWLATKTPPELTLPSDTASDTPTGDRIVDSLLLSVQKLLILCPERDEDVNEDRDSYIRDDNSFVFQMADKLGLDMVENGLAGFFVDLASASQSSIKNSVDRLLPFLEQYSWLATRHISNHAGWTKALFKLNHIICSIVLRVAKDGFCQPQDSEEAEGEGAEGKELVDGSGLGEGTGKENVSKDIQDESQVEGLQGDEGQADEKVERAEEGNAIEMSEDFGGEMQDVSEGEEDEEDSGDEGSDVDPEERQEELDPSDENAIDEKLWGDEQGSEKEEQSGKTNEDHSTKETGQSDVVAKESEQKSKDRSQEAEKPQSENTDTQPEEQMEDEVPMESDGEETGGPDGAPLDEHLQDANALDLPDDMQLEEDVDGGQEESAGDSEDDLMDDGEEPDDQRPDDGERDAGDDAMSEVDEAGLAQATNEDVPDQKPTEENVDPVVAAADTHAGDGSGTGEKSEPVEATQSNATEPQDGGSGSTGETGGPEGEHDKSEESETTELPDPNQSSEPTDPSTNTSLNEMPTSGDATGTRRTGAQSTPQARSEHQMPNPLRSLGDALKDVAQRFSEILDNMDPVPQQQPAPGTEDIIPQQLEYVQEDDSQTEMQALGPARQDEVARLRDLNLIDEETDAHEQDGPVDNQMQIDEPDPAKDAHLSSLKAEETSGSLGTIESVLTPADVLSRQPANTVDAEQKPIPLADVVTAPERDELGQVVELEVREWHSRGQPSGEAEHIWRRYESLTHDLAYALCEQLRLILEPTMATRLKGDYRTGKRLNMKKIIPYIASEYTKDKIWLRRTRPSQREYQVLIALDDSRSMAESHSVHLAFQTLALVSKALNRLEVGDVAIAKFGQSVDVIHSFGGVPFNDQSGAKVMDAFRFDQKATQVLSLLETSLTLLEQARERNAASSSSAADLWQLEIIISDGICQDHEQLRNVLRRAEEQRVMVVFIILDSLHSNTASATSMSDAAAQNSILSMNQVAYKDVNGRMELTVSRYLDSFPFEYYVVVRDVEALPEVLSGTLKQFFERISEE